VLNTTVLYYPPHKMIADQLQ